MALRISFFKTQPHRVFTYKPRFWNPQKEEFEERVKRAREKYQGTKEGEDGKSGYVPGASIRGSFTKHYEVSRRYPGRQKLIRAVIIIAIAFILIMLFYMTDAYSRILSLMQ